MKNKDDAKTNVKVIGPSVFCPDFSSAVFQEDSISKDSNEEKTCERDCEKCTAHISAFSKDIISLIKDRYENLVQQGINSGRSSQEVLEKMSGVKATIDAYEICCGIGMSPLTVGLEIILTISLTNPKYYAEKFVPEMTKLLAEMARAEISKLLGGDISD